MVDNARSSSQSLNSCLAHGEFKHQALRDLDEGYAEAEQQFGKRFANIWAWRQALGTIWTCSVPWLLRILGIAELLKRFRIIGK